MLYIKVLKYLLDNLGKPCSGAKIAELNNVSRMAVCKAIKSLRDQGYIIDSKSSVGYTLTYENERLNSSLLKSLINNDNLEVFTHNSCDSTNELAKAAAKSKLEKSVLICAEHQTNGKGRNGREFFSGKNCGIYFSLAMRSSLCSNPLKLIALSSLAVVRSLKKICGKTAYIKWVNDVMSKDNKKLCGILAEGIHNSSNPDENSIIIGIGINLTTSTEEFPEYIKDLAGSVYSQDDIKHSKNLLLADIINNIFMILEGDQDALMKEYRANSCVIKKNVTVFNYNKTQFEALVLDIDDDAFLVVKDTNGKIRTINTAEVSIRNID